MTEELPVIGAIKICSSDQNLLAFIRRQFCFLNSDCFQFGSVKNAYATLSLANTSYRYSNSVILNCNQYTVTRAYTDGVFITDSAFRFRRLPWLANMFKRPYSHYHNIFYQSCLYPLIDVYQSHGWTAYHGSVVRKNGRSILIAGRPSAGKTKLSEMLVADGYEIANDNLAFCNGSSVIGLPMPLRANSDQAKKMGIPIDDSGYYEFRPPQLSKKVLHGPLSAIFILERADRNSCQLIDTATKSLEAILSELNTFAHEMAGYKLIASRTPISIREKTISNEIPTFLVQCEIGKLEYAYKEVSCRSNI